MKMNINSNATTTRQNLTKKSVYEKNIFLALFFMLSGGALIAALPTSPLNEEYTITGNETVHNGTIIIKWVITAY